MRTCILYFFSSRWSKKPKTPGKPPFPLRIASRARESSSDQGTVASIPSRSAKSSTRPWKLHPALSLAAADFERVDQPVLQVVPDHQTVDDDVDLLERAAAERLDRVRQVGHLRAHQQPDESLLPQPGQDHAQRFLGRARA